MIEAYLVDAVRTPVGRRGGGLSHLQPADLGAHVLTALLERTSIDPRDVDDVIFGCVDQVGAQSQNVARTAWLAAGLPDSVPATTVDRQCGSSQQAAHFGAQGVLAGSYDLVIAGGVEVMSLVPLGSGVTVGAEAGFGRPEDSLGMKRRFGETPLSQFHGAQLIAERWGFSRREFEEYAVISHQRAAAAWDSGRFDSEVVAIGGVETDEGVRRSPSLAKMAGLPALAGYPSLTAAVASQISDGAAVMLIASAEAVARYHLEPLARFHSLAVVGSDPELMLTGTIPATERALQRGALALDDIDLFEVNEAFAPAVLAWARDTGASLDRTNVNGGAIALGHPLGATGARLMTTLVWEMHRSGSRYGLQTMCEGGGMANATILERVGSRAQPPGLN